MNIVSKYIPILSPSIYPKYTAENLPIIVRTALVALVAAGATQFALKQRSKLSKLRFTILLPALLIELIDLVVHFTLRAKRAPFITVWENRIKRCFSEDSQGNAPRFSPQEITAIARHIVEEFNNRGPTSHANFYVRRKNYPELPRALLFVEGTPYIVFNRTKKEDKLIGSGGDKKVRIAINLMDFQRYACCVLNEILRDCEQEAFTLVKDLPGFIQLIGEVKEYRETPCGRSVMRKDRLIMPLGDHELRTYSNNLNDKIKTLKSEIKTKPSEVRLNQIYEELSAIQDQKIDIIRQLLTSMEALHKKKLVHCDIKPFNIVVKEESENVFKTYIIDFGSMKKIYAMERDELELTPTYVSPELASAQIKALREPTKEEKKYQINKICSSSGQIPPRIEDPFEQLTDKLDVWALGITFLYLWSKRIPMWFENKESIDCYKRIVKLAGLFDKERYIKAELAFEKLSKLFNKTNTISSDGAALSSGQAQQQNPIDHPEIAESPDPQLRVAYKDFIIKVVLGQMLRVDPEERATAQEALEYLNSKIKH